MTVAELIAELGKYDPSHVVYVGTDSEIGQAHHLEPDCFELEVGPAVLIEAEPDQPPRTAPPAA